MVRVLFVQPPHRDTFGYSMPPLGLLRLAAVAQQMKHHCQFMDGALLVRRGVLEPGEELAARTAERILAERPELVGLGAMLPSLPAALELAAELRARAPELPILLGGQGPERVEEQVLSRHPALDAIAVGEAEASFAALLGELGELGDQADAQETPGAHDDALLATRRARLRAELRATHQPGFVVAADGSAPRRNPPRALVPELDALPSPAWELAESPASYAAAAGGGEALFPLDLGRGCPFSCRFCTTSVFWEHRARWLSPARAVDEMERLAAQPGLDVIYVTHDLFTADRDHALALCAELQDRELALTWECRTRLDLVDQELLTALGRAGCRRILFGVESVSPERLAAMRKGGGSGALDHAEVLRRLGEAAECGVAAILGLMIGLPGETRDDVEANLRLAAEAALIPGLALSLHWYTPTPGNAHMADDEAPLIHEPRLGADLVRGHDLPAGRPPERQRRMVAEDAEVFRAFRVHVPAHTNADELHRLTRHAHLLLEVLPRSLALAAERLETRLVELLSELIATSLAATPDDEPEAWSEPGVLLRGALVHATADALRRREPADAPLRDLVDYEQALFETDAPRLLRLDHDPREPRTPRPTRLLLQRHGERVRAHSVSERLALAFESGSATEAERERLHDLLNPTSPPTEVEHQA